MTNLEIVFITSSRIKLAHAQYLVKNYNLTITKQKNYGIGYVEPRIYNREQLLSESYKDACKRFNKNISNPDDKFFIIEDTSVIIEALSSDNHEVPGLDIKYWMKENTFGQLDFMLKEIGNKRNCSVRSDIILHLPRKLKEKYNKEYIQFTGIVNGFITDKEYIYATNVSYPWLDNKTFNKWFAPDNTIPLGMMDIDTSLKYDFRKKAFDKLLSFLEKENYISQNDIKNTIQYSLPLYFNNFILVGPTCAGKSTLAKYLSKNYGYYHIEASDFMYKKFYELHGIKSDIKIGDFAKQALEENSCIVSDLVIDEISHLKESPFVISGFRNPLEIECFLQKYREDIQIVYIDASINIRYTRNLLRERKDDEHSFDKFQKKDIQQKEMGLSNMLNQYKDSLILNEKTFESFYRNFESKYSGSLPLKIRNTNDIDIDFSKLKLEEAILVAMYLAGNDNFYTTTELSTLIKKRLQINKNKNNISRYFNQKFYPYYDIEVSNPIKYRLNSTGISQSTFIYQKLYKKN
ncbi:MAG: non-canonical purine NTP pyrophosphatase [Arcobacteraceae bacterium]